MDVPLTQLPPGDPKLVEAIVQQLKSGGKFDQFRKECLADVDTKPAYQNLQLRVESQVKKFLSQTLWKNDLNKNQLRDGVRKHVQESGMLDTGIDSIINQVVNPKIQTVILPCVEESVYAFLNIDPSQTRVLSPGGLQGGPDCPGVPRPLLSDAPHTPGPHDGSGSYSHMPPQHMPVHPSITPYPPHVPQHLPPQMASQHYPSQFAPPPPLPQHQPPPPPHYPPMYHVSGMVPSDEASAARHYQPSMDMGPMGPLPPMGPGIGPPGSHPPLPPPSVPHQPPPPMSLPPQIGPPPPPSAGSGGSGLCPPYMGSDIDSPVLGPPGIDDIERRRDYRADLNDPRLPPPGESSDDRHEYSAAKFDDTRLPPSSSGRDASDLDQHIDREDHHHHRSGKYDDPRLPSAGIDSPELAKDRHSDYSRSGKYDSPRMEADHHHKERHEHRKKYEEHRRRSPSSPDDLRKPDSRHSAGSSSHRTKYEDSRKYEPRSYERKYDDRRYDSDEPMDFDQPDSRASESRGSKSRHRRDPRDFGEEYSGHPSSQRAASGSKERSRHHHHKPDAEERSRYRHLGGDMEERSHHHPAPDMEERSRHHPAPDMEEKSRHYPAPDMEEKSRHYPALDMEERSRHHPSSEIEERSRHRGILDFEERSRPRPASDLDDSTHSLGQKPSSPLPPMETDVISSEEDDILGAKSASVSPASSNKNIPVGEGEEARDGFPRPHSAASDVGAAAGEVQRLSLRDKDHHVTAPSSPQPAPPPHLPLFDAQSLDSISSNSSGFSFGGGAASKTSSQTSLHSPDGGDLRGQRRQGSRGATTPPPGDEPPQQGRRSPADGGRDPQSPDPVARVATPDGAMMQDSLLSGASPISAEGSVDSADSNQGKRPHSAASVEGPVSPLEPCAPGTEERISPLLQPPPEPSGSLTASQEAVADPRPAAEPASPAPLVGSGSVSARPPSPVDPNPDVKKDEEKQVILDDHYSEKAVIVPKKDDDEDKDGASGGGGGSSSQGTASLNTTSSGDTSSTPTGESQQQQKADTPAGNDSQTETESVRLAKLREELKARNLHVVARPHHMPYHKIFKTPICVPREKKVSVNGQLNSSKKSSDKQSSVKKEIKSNYAPTAFENALLGLEYKKKVVLPIKAKTEPLIKSGSLTKSSGKEVQAIVTNAKVEDKSTPKSQKESLNKVETSKHSSSKDIKKVSDKDDPSSKSSHKYSNTKRADSHRSSRDSKGSDKSSHSKSSDDRRKSGLDSKSSSKHHSTKSVVDSKSKTEDRRKQDDSKSRSSHDAERNSVKLKSEDKKIESSKSKDDKDRSGSTAFTSKKLDPKSSSDSKVSSNKDSRSSSKLNTLRDSRLNSKEDPGKENKRDNRKSTPDSALEKSVKTASKPGTKDGAGSSTKEGTDKIISSNSLGANDKRDLSTKKEALKKRPFDSSDSEDNVSTAKKPRLPQKGHRSNDREKTLKTPASNQSRESIVPKKKYSSSRGSDSDGSCSRSLSSSNESSSSTRNQRSNTAKLLNAAGDDSSDDEDFTPKLSSKKNSDKLNSRKRTRGGSSNSSSDSDDDNERSTRKKNCSVKRIDRRNRIHKRDLLSFSSDSDDDISKNLATSSSSVAKQNLRKKRTQSPPSDVKSLSNIKAEIEPKLTSVTSDDVDEDVLNMANNIVKRLSSDAKRAAFKTKSLMPLSDADSSADEDGFDNALSGKNKGTKTKLSSLSLNSSQESNRSMAPLVLENSDSDSSDSAYEMLRQEVKTNNGSQTTRKKFTRKSQDGESQLLSLKKERRKSITSSKKSSNNSINSRTVPKLSPKKHKRSNGDYSGPEHIEVTKDGVMIMTDSGKKILLSYDDSQGGHSTCSGLFNSDDEAESFEGFGGVNLSSDETDGIEFEGFNKVMMHPSVVVLEDIFDFVGFPGVAENSNSGTSLDAAKKYSALLNLIEKMKHESPVSSPRKYKKKDLSLTVTGDMFNKDLPIKVYLDSMVKLGAQVTGFHAFLVKSPKRKNRKMDTTFSSPGEILSSCAESPFTPAPSNVTLPIPLQSRAERAASRGAKRVTPDTSDSELHLPQSLLQSSTREDRPESDACPPFTTSDTVLRDIEPMHSDLVLLTPEDDQLQSEGSCSSPKELEASPYVPLSPSSDGSADGGVMMDHHDKQRVMGKLTAINLS